MESTPSCESEQLREIMRWLNPCGTAPGHQLMCDIGVTLTTVYHVSARRVIHWVKLLPVSHLETHRRLEGLIKMVMFPVGKEKKQKKI